MDNVKDVKKGTFLTGQNPPPFIFQRKIFITLSFTCHYLRQTAVD